MAAINHAAFSDLSACYVRGLFAREDDAMLSYWAESRAAGLPEIAVDAEVGALLQLLARLANAKRILEIGTLGGYSGAWLARGLQPGGKLISLEINEVHAAFARKFWQKAKLSECTEIRMGSALETLPALAFESPFDLVFIDADKSEYPGYLAAVKPMLRPGGLLVADNALGWGGTSVADPALGDNAMPGLAGMREFNRLVATDPDFTSTILRVREGVLVAMKQG